MATKPAGPSICPDCKGLVRALNERCPTCGRKVDWSAPRPWYKGRWGIGLGVLALLWVIGTMIGPGRTLRPGDHAVVLNTAAKGAWFAVNEDAFGEMVDAQNAASTELMGRLAEQARVFREPNGSQVLVVQVGLGNVLVKVKQGANVGSEGWIQREALERVQP